MSVSCLCTRGACLSKISNNVSRAQPSNVVEEEKLQVSWAALVMITSPSTRQTFFEWVFSGGYFLGVFSFISSGSPHVLGAHMGRTCGEPNEIELAPIGMKFTGRRVPFVDLDTGTRVFGVGSQRKDRSRVQPRS